MSQFEKDGNKLYDIASPCRTSGSVQTDPAGGTEGDAASSGGRWLCMTCGNTVHRSSRARQVVRVVSAGLYQTCFLLLLSCPVWRWWWVSVAAIFIPVWCRLPASPPPPSLRRPPLPQVDRVLLREVIFIIHCVGTDNSAKHVRNFVVYKLQRLPRERRLI